MDRKQYYFTVVNEDPDDFEKQGIPAKAIKYSCNDLPNEMFYRSKQYDVYIPKAIVQSRLPDLVEGIDKNERNREDDFGLMRGKYNPFMTCKVEDGMECNIPRQFASKLSQQHAEKFENHPSVKLWQEVVTNLAAAQPKAGTSPQLSRFVFQPTTPTEVFFTPTDPPVFNVTKEMLDTVIKNHQKDDNGVYYNWRLRALAYNEAVQAGYRIIGTDFLHIYNAWMRPLDYAALWIRWDNPPSLSLPFPQNDLATLQATLLQYATLNQGLNTGAPHVDGVGIPLSTQGMQGVAGGRKSDGDKGLEIMGKSATLFNVLWGPNPPATGMHNTPSEWLHRAAYSFGAPNADDPSNIIFGSAECNTDMIRAENVVKNLLSEYGGDSFSGVLRTTRTTAGTQVARKDHGLVNPVANVPGFMGDYSWLCFELQYEFRMPANRSPLGEDLNATTTFEPWSLHVPTHIEPRMDIWLIKHLKANHYKRTGKSKKKLVKAFSDTSFLESLSLLDTVDSDDDVATVAWRAAEAGLPELKLPGLVVKNPRVLAPVFETPGESDLPDGPKAFPLPVEAETPVPSQGFVLQGDVGIFGTPIIGQLEKWMGPPPADVNVGTDTPRWERVTLPGDFHLSTLLPLLKDTPYDVITFRNVAIWYQNYEFDTTRAVGWHFDADWVIDSSCGVLHDVLRTVLKVDEPVLKIRSSLGWNQDWEAPVTIHSFTLEGSFAGLSLSPISGLRLTSIGVRLLGIRGFELNPKPHTTLSYGFGIFGTMTVDVPGSIIPLNLDYSMDVYSSNINISATLSGDIWNDALGIPKLTLEDVTFTTSFSLSSPWKSLSFSISATFWYFTSQAFFSGTFSPGSGHIALSAKFHQFDIHEIDSIFCALFGDSLSLPKYDLRIGSAVLSIASGTGVSLALQNVNVAGHTAFDVAVSFSKSGVELSGALSSSVISFGEVSIRHAALRISFWTEGKKQQVDFMIAGTLGVEFLHATVEAAVHLYPGQSGVDWTVIARLSADDKPIAMSDIVSIIDKGSYLDLSLKDALIIAASRDDPDMRQELPHGYAVRQGIQVAANIVSLPVLNGLLKGSVVSGLILSAGWLKESGFNLKIDLPAPTTIDFGNGIRSTPMSLEIRTQPLELAVSAGLIVPVKDSTPLDFSFELAASFIEASATGEMQGWWVKPFGVENLKIGPKVGLTIGVNYSMFASTGTPTTFGVDGGFMIGSTPARVTMKVSENPKDELLSGKIENLDISDVIAFGSELVRADIPKIPDLLKFEELSIYICPFGVNFGKTTYPAGFSFKAHMIFLGHKADIECTIDKTKKSISLNGGVDSFKLGPLSVHGATGDRATVNCDLGMSKQELAIDGAAALFDMQVQINTKLQFLPNPTLKFHTILKFAKVFAYELNAELLGSLDTLKDADFSLTSTFENHILEYVTQLITEQLEVVKVGAQHGLQVAEQRVHDAKNEWRAGVANAQRELADAHRKWKEHEQSIRRSNQPIIDGWVGAFDDLKRKAEEALSVFTGAVAESRAVEEQADRNRAVLLPDAKNKVDKARQRMKEEERIAQKDFDDADATLSQTRRMIEKTIKNMEVKLTTVQYNIEDLTAKIDDYTDAPFFYVWKKAELPTLAGQRLVLELERSAVKEAWDLANAAWNTMDYMDKVAKVDEATTTLETVKRTGQATLDGAIATQAETDQATQRDLDRARQLLKQRETGPEFVSWQETNLAFEAHNSTRRTIHDVAVDLIDKLMTSGEYLLYRGAQGALDIAENFTDVLGVVEESLHLMERATETFDTVISIMQEIVKFGAKAVNVESITLSGTLRGALGLEGANSRPLSATVTGYVLGASFAQEVTFDPRDALAFVKALFDRLWDILKGNVGILTSTASSVKSAPAPILPISVSPPTVTFDTLSMATSEGEPQWFDSLLPPVPSQHQSLVDPVQSTPHTDVVTFFAPLIPVEDQVRSLPFSVARARFLEYRVEGTLEDTERAKQRGLVVIPAGPFTAGPPSNLYQCPA